MTSQVFINEVKGNFNLRRPKSSKPTNIYYVVYMFGKQNYFATGLKIYPKQWDKQRQQAIISNKQTKLDNKNNEVINEKLSLIESYLSEYKAYICENPEEIEKGNILLRNFIYKDMKKDKASNIIKSAFDYYYYTLNSQVADSTLKGVKSLLLAYLKYLDENGDSIDALTQQGLNDFQEYLIKETKENENSGVVRINKKCQLVERLINNVIAVRSEYLKYNLHPVKYVPLKDTRSREEINRFPLEENEIEAIKNIKLDEKLDEFRDIFLLQISCGQRISDLCKLINKDYTEQGNYYIIKTQKEKTKAFIEKTKVIDSFFTKYKDGFKYAFCRDGKLSIDTNGKPYNYAIRKICELAKVDREIEFVDSKGKERKEPLYKVIVNHDARHTFITMKLREGMLPNELCELSGHADDEMINRVYAHLTSTDKIKKLEKAKERMSKKKNEETSNYMEELLMQKLIFSDNQKINNYGIDREADTSNLTKEELDFINKTMDEFSVGSPSVKVRKIINSLLQKGVIIKLNE